MDLLKEIKLTEYSHGAGCGCKIAPKVLDAILTNNGHHQVFETLLVGNDERDDAAVMDLGDGTAIISTTDFFMPIVDDPADFGRIASVNAISDVYAMGGKPILAIAILGWPIDKLPAALANEVINGARNACKEAGIPLAGGHSIDSPEPIFGLAVTGRVNITHLKKNGGAEPGCKLFLTKPIGVGILTTAQKQKKRLPEHDMLARNSMVQLNSIGEMLGTLPYVKAMTDVTGFGLLGHLSEMCEASGASARVDFEKVPFINRAVLDNYLEMGCIPGGTQRNWASYGHKIGPLSDHQKYLLCDPQTSGGLLVAISPEFEQEFVDTMNLNGFDLEAFGEIKEKGVHLVEVV